MTTAREMMRPCPEVREGTTVAEMVRRMAEQPEFYFAVTRESGQLVGIVTEYDLVKLVYESGQYDFHTGVGGRIPVYLGMSPEQLRALTAADIMSTEPETVGATGSADEVAALMFRHKRKVVLVAEAGKLLGAIQRVDLVEKVLG